MRNIQSDSPVPSVKLANERKKGGGAGGGVVHDEKGQAGWEAGSVGCGSLMPRGSPPFDRAPSFAPGPALDSRRFDFCVAFETCSSEHPRNRPFLSLLHPSSAKHPPPPSPSPPRGGEETRAAGGRDTHRVTKDHEKKIDTR